MSEPLTMDRISGLANVQWEKAIQSAPFPFTEADRISKATGILYLKQNRSAFDTLFQLSNRHRPWAHFAPPEGYYRQALRFFQFSLIPSLDLSPIDQLLTSPLLKEAELRSALLSLKECYLHLSEILLSVVANSKIVKG